MRKKLESEIHEMIIETLSTDLDEFNTFITNAVHTLLDDDEFLRKIGQSMAIAEAMRISKEVDRTIEDMTAKEIEMSDSPEPWFEWVCTGIDQEKGARHQFAYNNAFIQFVKSTGITGSSSDEIFLRYVGTIGTDAMLEEYD